MAKKPALSSAEIAPKCRVELAPLSRWINACLRAANPVPRDTLARSHARAFTLCEQCGVFRRVGLAESVTCAECEDPHVGSVAHDDGRFYYWFLANGRVDLTEDDVTLLAFDRATLLGQLATAAGLSPSKRRLYACDRLVSVGFIAEGDDNGGWVLGYTDGLEDQNVLAGVTEALAKQFHDGPGLLATPSAVNLNMPLPRRYQLVALHDLFFGEDDRLSLNRDVAQSHLGRRKKVPGTPGRPSDRQETQRIWSELHPSNEWPSSRNAQVELVLARWPSDNRTKPARGTIENHLRELEKAEDKGAQPS